jgi:cysteinyl-tRNA synthetase, unknown class
MNNQKIINSQYILLCTFMFLLLACKKTETAGINYRQEMRNFIINLSKYAKEKDPEFLIIPQNGQELITHNGEYNGIIYLNYIQSIDATAREDLFYGYTDDNKETPDSVSANLSKLCNLYHEMGIEVFVIDYCSSPAKIDSSYAENYNLGFISFAAPERNLNVIPRYPAKPFHENGGTISTIHSVENFLYLINSENFATKDSFIKALSSTYYDMVVIDLFHFEEAFTPEEIDALKTKPNGNRRLVVCYMSIGEAENYRFYWQKEWNNTPPAWLGKENSSWEGNFNVEYWNTDWQKIIYGTTDSYLDKILSAQYDGAYLDLVDEYEYYE